MRKVLTKFDTSKIHQWKHIRLHTCHAVKIMYSCGRLRPEIRFAHDVSQSFIFMADTVANNAANVRSGAKLNTISALFRQQISPKTPFIFELIYEKGNIVDN